MSAPKNVFSTLDGATLRLAVLSRHHWSLAFTAHVKDEVYGLECAMAYSICMPSELHNVRIRQLHGLARLLFQVRHRYVIDSKMGIIYINSDEGSFYFLAEIVNVTTLQRIDELQSIYDLEIRWPFD